MRRYCGLMSVANPCACERYLPLAREQGWLKPERPLFATVATGPLPVPEPGSALTDAAEELARLLAIYRQPRFRAPEGLVRQLQNVIGGQRAAEPS